MTDAEKRKSYDLYGSDEQQNISRGGGGYHRTYQYGYTRGFEADVTAEELFNMFFGGGAFPTQNVYSSRHRRFHRQNQEEREVKLKKICFVFCINCNMFSWISARIHRTIQSYSNSVVNNSIGHVLVLHLRPNL